MTTSTFNSLSRRKCGGFTLVELMIATSLGSIILAGVLSTFLMLVRSGIRVSNYSVMETETRRAFERLGIDARASNSFDSTIVSGVITSFTISIPTHDRTDQQDFTYGFDASDPTNKKFYMVPGTNPAATAGRQVLVNKIDGLTFSRYDKDNVLIPTSTVSDASVKHVQVTVNVSRSAVGVATASQFIRSSAFTIRNIATISLPPSSP